MASETSDGEEDIASCWSSGRGSLAEFVAEAGALCR
jgi:hypothetical protein